MPHIPFLSRSSRSSKPPTTASSTCGTRHSSRMTKENELAESIDNLLQSGQLSPSSAVFLTDLRYGVAQAEDEQILQSTIKELDGLSSGVGTGASGSTVDSQTNLAPRFMGSGTSEGRGCAGFVRDYLCKWKDGEVFEDVNLDDELGVETLEDEWGRAVSGTISGSPMERTSPTFMDTSQDASTTCGTNGLPSEDQNLTIKSDDKSNAPSLDSTITGHAHAVDEIAKPPKAKVPKERDGYGRGMSV